MIKVNYRKKFKKVWLLSGNWYSFFYKGASVDRIPFILLMGWYSGISNRQTEYRFIQGINCNYLSPRVRNQFYKTFFYYYQQTANIKLTWRKLINRYPWIKQKGIIRRYFYKPTTYIQQLKHIDFESPEMDIMLNAKMRHSVKSQILKTKRQLPWHYLNTHGIR